MADLCFDNTELAKGIRNKVERGGRLFSAIDGLS